MSLWDKLLGREAKKERVVEVEETEEERIKRESDEAIRKFARFRSQQLMITRKEYQKDLKKAEVARSGVEEIRAAILELDIQIDEARGLAKGEPQLDRRS